MHQEVVLAAQQKVVLVNTNGNLPLAPPLKHAPYAVLPVALPPDIVIPTENVLHVDRQIQIMCKRKWCGFPQKVAQNIIHTLDAATWKILNMLQNPKPYHAVSQHVNDAINI